MATSFYNLVRCKTATKGTGTLTIGAAVDGYLTPALAGAVTGATVSYGIKDGKESEVGHGVYTAATQALTRVVENSTNSGSAISLTGNAEVFFTVLAGDFSNLVSKDDAGLVTVKQLAIDTAGVTLPAYLINVESQAFSIYKDASNKWTMSFGNEDLGITPQFQLNGVTNTISFTGGEILFAASTTFSQFTGLVKFLGNVECDTPVTLTEQGSAPTAEADHCKLYVKDKSGVATLYYMKGDGTEVEL